MYLDNLDVEDRLFSLALKRAAQLKTALRDAGVLAPVRVSGDGSETDPEVTVDSAKVGYAVQVCAYVVGGCPYIVQHFNGRTLRNISTHRGARNAARAFVKVAM